jgi:hypothetical protein
MFILCHVNYSYCNKQIISKQSLLILLNKGQCSFYTYCDKLCPLSSFKTFCFNSFPTFTDHCKNHSCSSLAKCSSGSIRQFFLRSVKKYGLLFLSKFINKYSYFKKNTHTCINLGNSFGFLSNVVHCIIKRI